MRMGDRLQWDVDGHDWPNRAWSRFVTVGRLRWHVQVSPGRGETVLLVHGTGASTHSWRDLAQILATRYRVVAMDLPGHGFTAPLPAGCASLPVVARELQALLDHLELEPQLAIGHSAGAAIAARMVLDGTLKPRAIVSLNGALLPLPGLSGTIFPPVAKLLAANSLAARMFAWRATDPAAVRRLVASTGSTLDRDGLAYYGRLIRSPAHVAGTLQMMAGWDLAALRRDLPRLSVPMLMIVGLQDGTVSPAEADRMLRVLPQTKVVRLAGLGHLAHEEQAATVARDIAEFVAAF
jgi:magnesium chelatase accessory protein